MTFVNEGDFISFRFAQIIFLLRGNRVLILLHVVGITSL